MNSSLPFDTNKFDELPISIFICKPVLNADGFHLDYRIVFGNEPFARLLGKENFVDGLVSENIDREKFLMTQFGNLPAPYVGFTLTSLTEHEKISSRDSPFYLFLR